MPRPVTPPTRTWLKQKFPVCAYYVVPLLGPSNYNSFGVFFIFSFLRSLLLAFSFFVLRSVRCGLCFSLLSGMLCNYVSLRSWIQKFNCFFVFRHKGVQLAGQQKELGAAIETVSGLELYFKIYHRECEGEKEPESSLSNRLKLQFSPKVKYIFCQIYRTLRNIPQEFANFLYCSPSYSWKWKYIYVLVCSFPKSFCPFALFSALFCFPFLSWNARTDNKQKNTNKRIHYFTVVNLNLIQLTLFSHTYWSIFTCSQIHSSPHTHTHEHTHTLTQATCSWF